MYRGSSLSFDRAGKKGGVGNRYVVAVPFHGYEAPAIREVPEDYHVAKWPKELFGKLWS